MARIRADIGKQSERELARVDRLESVQAIASAWFVTAEEDREAIDAARAVYTEAAMDCGESIQRLQRILSYSEDAPKWRARLGVVGKALTERESDKTWFADYRATVRRWPKLREAINGMEASLRDARKSVERHHDRGVQAADASDAYAMGQAVVAGENALDVLVAIEEEQAEEVELVGDTIDWILVDWRPGRAAQLKLLTIQGKAGESGPWTTTEGSWQPVGARSKVTQTAVGMVILHKAPGQLMSDADTHPTPPGWHYVNDRRHGRWSGSGPTATWTFNAGSAWMKEVYWGTDKANYRPITRAEYDAYVAARGEGKTYLGKHGDLAVYGLMGVWTRKRFPSSSAVASGQRTRRDLLYRRAYGTPGPNYGGRSGLGSGGRAYGGYGK
ncbi:MAG: hypothetical protein AAGA48_28995 [Myxococcota bacterium]